jgi:hypothetical protein
MSEPIITNIMGKRGSGKSYLARQRIAEFPRSLVYDTMGEYTSGVICEDLAELKTVWQRSYQGNFRIIYRPLDAEEEFEPLCRLVWECGNMGFLVEEVQTFCNARSICRDFKAIIAKGRHRGISLIGVTQRPAEISKLLTSQAKEFCIFNTTEPNDIEYFRNSLGSDIVAKISELKEYEYVRWTDGGQLLITKA